MAINEHSGLRRGNGPARRLLPLNLVRWVGILMAAVAWLAFNGNVIRASESQLPTASRRLRIEPAANADWSARVGYVEISSVLKTAGGMGVFDDQGKPVASKLLWSPPNQPALLCFDISHRSKAYYVCFGPDLPSAPGGWSPQAGVLLETRPCGDLPAKIGGRNSESAKSAQASELIAGAGPVQGRGFVQGVRHSVNPFGPSSHYLANYTGWFRIEKAGNYGFATDSSGPTILNVDGRQVATWLGEHNARRGRKAQHSGEIHLQPGVHCLQYLSLQLDGEKGCEVAWKPPGQSDYEVMEAGSFLPVARFRATKFVSTAQPEQLYFSWQTEDMCALGNVMLLRVRFLVADDAQPRQYRWRFDDGGTATGSEIQHTYVQGGVRQVTLEAWEHGELVASNTARLRIAVDWSQPEWWRERLYAEMKRELVMQDLDKMPANELGQLAVLAERANDQVFLRQLGKLMVQRAGEFTTPAAAGWFYQLGLAFTHQGDEGDDLAKTCYRLALEPARAGGAVADKARLRLAELLIDVYGQTDEAQSLLRQIRGSFLSNDEARLQKRLAGDMAAAQGQIEIARKQYAAVASSKNSPNNDLTRITRLESVNLLLEHKQLDEAWVALAQLQLDFPLERLSPGTGLIEVELALRRNCFQRAFTECQRLLPLAKDDLHLPELLYHTVESGMALNKIDEAKQALRRLESEFPYSEATAKAKDKWPRG